MRYSTEDLLSRLKAGEDGEWEFKEVRFEGARLKAPKRNDIADEIAAHANSQGGVVVFGVTDCGDVQGMTREQMDALDRVLVEVCTQSIEPALAVQLHRRELEGRHVMVVAVPKGHSQHDSPGGSYHRVGSSKIKMTGDQRLRLAQERAMSRFTWLDKAAVPDTGFQSLDEALWKRLVSTHGMADPEVALEKMGLLARDEHGTLRASVAGLLLCARAPETWLDHACVTATCYRGSDRTSMQVDAETICGPLDKQIGATVAFVLRNMRVAARKEPGRVDLPQYSARAVFEAVVNAVAHRDYSMAGRRIRVSVFEDRVEVQSPGSLANGLRVDIMDSQQATRNEALASALARMSCTDIKGSGDRQYFMEKRGDGVGIIRRETEALGAKSPSYELVGNTELRLEIPAAPLGWTPGSVGLTVRSDGRPVADADILLIFPDGTYRRAATNVEGAAVADLHSTHLPMTVFAAAPGFAARVVREWAPNRTALSLDLELAALPGGGSVVFPDGAGEVPGLRARLNPVRDVHDRTSLYVSGATINKGAEQPVHFAPGEALLVTDSVGTALLIRIPEVLVKPTILQYEPWIE